MPLFRKEESNRKKVSLETWQRLILGGLAEILQVLPKKEYSREFYEKLFVTLATRVAGLQNPDGYWHASVLDPQS